MSRDYDMDPPLKKKMKITGLRCITSAFAIVTSRQVMSKGFHYPYHLLMVHALTILLSQALVWLLHALRSEPDVAQDRSQHCAAHTGVPRALIILLPFIHMSCVVGTLLCVYQAALHFTAFPVLIMLLTLDWGSIFTNTERLSTSLVLACVSTCSMAMIFIFDLKLSNGGINGSVGAIAFTSLARLIDLWMKKICDAEHSSPCIRWQSPLAAPLLLTVISAAMIRRYEYPIYTPVDPGSLGDIMAFNIICVLAAWYCNLEYFLEVPNDSLDSEYMGTKELRYLVTPLAIVGLVTAGSSYALPPVIVSAWQQVGFLIALSTIYIASHLPRQTAPGDAEKNYEQLAEADSREAPTAKAHSRRIPIALCMTLLVGGLLFLNPMHWSDHIPGPHRATFRTLVTAPPTTEDNPSSLDFVVSRFDESAKTLAENLTPMLHLKATPHRTVRIIVYNTGDPNLNSTFRNDIQRALPSHPQIIIEHRPNVGREGAAFLHHITTEWDNLADHTLFMQAQPHEPAHIRWILHHYFIPSTGFLSLSALQDVCAGCDDCWDHSTWSESQTVLEDIYSRANRGAKCRSFALTYRGQFVASRTRIQSRGKQLFEDLLDWMVNPESEKHSEEYLSQPWLPQKVDNLNNPLFGYTLERMWGVLMGCSDPKLALKCPSRLSIAMKVLKVKSMGLEDCQCLDDSL